MDAFEIEQQEKVTRKEAATRLRRTPTALQ
jgi:hypothetical protein